MHPERSRARERPLHVLALNRGSSSLKFGLYRIDAAACTLLHEDAVERADARAMRSTHGLFPSQTRSDAARHDPDDIADVGRRLATAGLPSPDVVGHRVVHGGPGVRHHCVLDATVLASLEDATPFAPLHMPGTLALIEDARLAFPQVPQVACLDTAFHADLPDIARVLPIPRHLESEGLLRYGFHGLSCESIVRQFAGELPERLVIAHLGSGASVTAVRAGRSVDTTMGLTPTGGVVMRSRSGDLDPGVILFLMRKHHLDGAGLERLLDEESGLAGIAASDGDMRTLHAAAPSDANARLAIDLFCYSVQKAIAAMIVALDGIDVLVFTGGIGEHDALVRTRICTGLTWANVRSESASTRTKAWASGATLVMPSRENLRIAEIAAALGSDVTKTSDRRHA